LNRTARTGRARGGPPRPPPPPPPPPPSRYTKKFSNRSEFYTGLAYEYEFGSDAGATYLGYSTPSPSLKGGTGLLELGYQFAPQDGRVRYGVNLMGMTGKRRGLAGSVQINWAF